MTDTLDSVVLDRDKQRMLRGSVLMTLSPLSALFLGILISLLIEAYIPPTNYAIYPWFLLVYTFFGTTLLFRLPMAIHYYLAAAKGEDNEKEMQGLIKTNTLLALILTPLSGILTFLIVPPLFTSLNLGGLFSIIDVLICALGVSSLTLSTFSVSTLKGLQEFEVIGIGQLVSNLCGQIVIIALLIVGIGYLGIVSIGIPVLLLKWVILGALTTLILSLAVRNAWTLKGSAYPLRPLLRFSIPLLISFLFIFFFSEVLVLFFLNPFPEELGLYGFAVRIANFINALTLGFYAALGSYYALSYGKSNRESVENDVRWSMKISVFLFLPLAVGCMVISPALFLLIFPNYYWAYQYFIILMIQIVFIFFKKPYMQILNVFGKTNFYLFIEITSAILSGFLMYLFFTYGSAIIPLVLLDNVLLLVVFGYISSNLFAAFFSAIVIKRVLRIRLGLNGVIPILFIGFIIIPPAMVIHFLYLPPIYELVIIFLMTVVIYLLPIRYLRIMSETEIKKASQLLPKRLAGPFARLVIRLFVRRTNNH